MYWPSSFLSLKAVGKNCNPTGVALEQASNTARGTPRFRRSRVYLLLCPGIVRCRSTRVLGDPAFRAPFVTKGTGKTGYDAPASLRTGALPRGCLKF